MANSMRGQDELNPVLWLATRAGKMDLLARSGLPAVLCMKNFPEKPYNKIFIDQVTLWTLTLCPGP